MMIFSSPVHAFIRSVLALALALLLPACGGSSSSGGSGGGAGGGSATPPPPTPAPNANSPMGTNLSELAYYSTELVFQDSFKQTSHWLPQLPNHWTWDTGLPFAGFTPDGYPLLNPGQAAGTLLFRGVQGRYPGGPYTCFYDGTGTIDFFFDAAVTSRSTGRIELNVATPTNEGIHLKITASDPADPIRNIRLVPQMYLSTYATQPFTPRFLERHKRFKMLRFMFFQKMISATLADWADRPTPTTYSQASFKGVALEHMIDLCNTLDADPWFCMHHLANDAYVTAFATMVRDRLKPTLKVYIEHSNEVWNSIYPQAPYCQQRGLALGLSANAFEAQLRYHSRRSVEIFGLWQSVFGGTDRLVRVLASQSANPWTGNTVMGWQNAYAQADALAIAPYFGGYLGSQSTQATVAAMTVPQILAACSSHIAGTITTEISQNAAAATTRGLDLIAYEAGQHLVGVGTALDNNALTALFIAANRDPGMNPVYDQYLAAWRANGGRMMANFTSVGAYSKWGSWGVLEFDDQNSGPKYDALMDFIIANPKWW